VGAQQHLVCARRHFSAVQEQFARQDSVGAIVLLGPIGPLSLGAVIVYWRSEATGLCSHLANGDNSGDSSCHWVVACWSYVC
jgi:hypothetical protein